MENNITNLLETTLKSFQNGQSTPEEIQYLITRATATFEFLSFIVNTNSPILLELTNLIAIFNDALVKANKK